MSRPDRFGRGGCYTCKLCGKRTRDAGGNAARGVCPECYDLGDIEVEVNDETITEAEGIKQAANRLRIPESKVRWGKHGFEITKDPE